MSIVTDINSEYGNVNDMYNPILKDILTNLDEFGFLDNLSVARNATSGSIKTYKNLSGNENKSAALEIIIDCISRGLLKAYQEGFTQGSSISDGASNIGFTELVPLPLLDINSSNNVHSVIFQLASEISQIKSGLAGLGVPLPIMPPGPTIQITLK